MQIKYSKVYSYYEYSIRCPNLLFSARCLPFLIVFFCKYCNADDPDSDST